MTRSFRWSDRYDILFTYNNHRPNSISNVPSDAGHIHTPSPGGIIVRWTMKNFSTDLKYRSKIPFSREAYLLSRHNACGSNSIQAEKGPPTAFLTNCQSHKII